MKKSKVICHKKGRPSKIVKGVTWVQKHYYNSDRKECWRLHFESNLNPINIVLNEWDSIIQG